MATLLPPPKRQKVYHGVPEPVPEPAKPSPHIVVQFVSEEDGKALAPAVNLPANVSRDALQTLVNKLNSQARLIPSLNPTPKLIGAQSDDPVPFSFHIALPTEFVKEGAPTRINIAKSLEEDVLNHSSQAFTTEDVFVVQCSPQAVFRVRPATRCSSTLSGNLHSMDEESWLTTYRSCLPDPMRLLLAYGQPPRDRRRRLQCTIMGPVYRATLSYALRSRWLGAVCRMGGHGAEARHGRT
jgi:hypothetical protein